MVSTSITTTFFIAFAFSNFVDRTSHGLWSFIEASVTFSIEHHTVYIEKEREF
jgi:hypothetical protein